jgi:ribonuclease HII
MSASRAAPDFAFERSFWRAGLDVVAGVDEVGRGALAGPLVAAAVVFPAAAGPALRRLTKLLGAVRDSKELPPERRTALVGPVRESACGVGIGIVEPGELDALGLAAANRVAMERAVLALPCQPHALLLDACTLDLGLPQSGPIGADGRCLSVAAASIIAKTTRDALMVASDDEDPRYGFVHHKGYGSALHLRRLDEHGPGPLHRRCFAPVARLLGTVP